MVIEMVNQGLRRLKKKAVRIPSGKSVMRYSREGGKKAHCALTKLPLQGTAYGKNSDVRKLSKTERRPNVIFGGVLSSKARKIIFEEAIKVKYKIKDINSVRLGYKKYVEQAINSIE